MSNQTFVKKDRISFAQNLNETIVIAPSNITTNALYIGPNSAITYDGDSNVASINYLQGVTLSNQYIYADGTYLSNLPTSSGITQSNMTSSLIGLGTFGYVSSSQLTSTVTGLGTSGSPATWANYPAINTVNLAGNIISNTDTILVNSISSATFGFTEFLNFVNFQNHDIYGVTNLQVDSFSANNYGNIRFDTSVNMNANEISNINAAYFGYTITTTYKDGLYMTEYTAPDSSVKSPALGLYANSIPFVGTSADNTLVNLYNVNSIWAANINTSSISGDGSKLFNLNAISSTSLQSTVTGLGNIYLSTNTVPSTIVGLGTFGYLSTNTVPSTIVGLGTFGYISSTQLRSTVSGLGNIYISTFNGSTTFLSTAVGFISSLNVNSLTVGTGLGYVDFGAIRAVIVSSIQTNTGLLFASSLTGDGSQIYNLNAISSLSLQSTVTGLGTFGYISSSQLQSTVTGLLEVPELGSTITGLGTFGYISSLSLQSTVTGLLEVPELGSTITGLGTFGYISSLSLQSTVTGLGNIYLSTNIVPSTIVGLGTFGYISSSQLQSTVTGLLEVPELGSTITGLGTFGYISSTQLTSTVTGLGNIYLSTNVVPSTIVGLGTFGYISSSQLQSTVTGLLEVPELGSTITGLGTFGYISSTQLTSTVTGLGNIYLSTFNGSTNFISSGQGFISSLNVNSLTFASGNGWLDLTALRAILVSTIQLDAAVGNFSSISGNGSQIVALNAISSLSLQSTVVGLGNIYLSSGSATQVSIDSTIIGLGTFGYISSTQLTSTVTGLGNIYISTNTVPSTIVGLGTFGYLSSFNSISTNNISAGNLFANIVNTSTISNTDGIFTNSVSTGNLFANIINGSTINILDGISTTSLNTLLINSSTINNLTNICTTRLFTRIFNASDGTYISLGGLGLNTGNGANLGQIGFQFNNIIGSNVFTSNISAGTISTRNLGVSTLFFSVAQGYQISTNRIVGDTRTDNLYPLTVGAQIGFGSNTGALGFYSEGHFRSTFTQVIQPTLDNDSFSNIVRINGNVSSQNINVSSIFGTLISTATITTNFLAGSGPGASIFSQNFYPQGVNILGYGNGGPGNGPWDSASIRLTYTSSIVTNNISAGVISVSSIRGDGSQLFNLNAISSLSLQSTIQGLGTFGYLSTNTVPSTIVGLGTFGYLSTNTVPSTIVGLGTFGYLSTNTVPSTIEGLGTFGYISSTQLTSTVTGLGNIYLSTFNGSTNFISSGQGFISSLNVNSLTFASGNGWLDLTALRAILVSTIQLDAAVGNFSSISGNGSQIVAFNAISSLSLQSTVVGLGNIYLSTNIVPSTIVGLGTFGYLSTNIVPSTIEGLGTFGYISSLSLQSTVVGLVDHNELNSSIIGLGTFGYISTTQLQSTVRGLGNVYISSLSFSSIKVSTIFDQYNITKTTSYDWNWFDRQWTNVTSNSYNTTTALYDFFYDNETKPASNTRFFHTSSLGTTGYMSNLPAFNNFKELITSHIYVYRPFTLNNVKFDLDDAGAFYINGNYIVGQSIYNAGAGTTYSYSFKVGWHRLDLIYYQGAGGYYIQLGWNPAQYQNFISAMTPFGPQDRIITMGGNVGIGTLNPSTTLDVVGVIRGTTLSSLNIFTSNISSFFYGGIEKYNYISTTGLQSTVVGLGTFGYLSTNIVPSTIEGLGTFGYLSTNIVPSTIVGLGTFGYLSTNTVPSTIVGLGTFGYLSTNIVPSTIIGLGTFGYLSTNIVPSTIIGLGTFGYISTTQLTSTVTGLGNIYLSTNIVPSTIIGLGTFGYISSLSLQSTVRTLESYYSIITLSTNANLSVSSLTFVETNTNSTTTLSYRSSMIYVGNNILYGALQYAPQFITF